MYVISKQDYREQLWKNGAGLTREIIRKDNGPENGSRVIWRLSLAAVTADGSFSTFPGSDRILTVVKGNGMRLIGNDEASFDAHPLRPVRFSGDLVLTGLCIDGPVTNFNLIFDRSAVDASVELITGAMPARTVPEQGFIAVHVLTGHPMTDSGVSPEPGDTAVFEGDSLPEFKGTWSGLVVEIRPRATSC